MVSGGLQDFELDGEDDEDWRLEDELQEDELRDVLEEMGWNNDEELEGDDAEHYRLENGSQEEEELRDILEEITPVDELARMDAIPIDPRLLEMANHAGGNLTVQDVLDQEFASMEENEMAALRPEDFESEDFELEWNF